jgi:hypothetical protein
MAPRPPQGRGAISFSGALDIAPRRIFLSLVVLLIAPAGHAQDLAPALAARFSEGAQALEPRPAG